MENWFNLPKKKKTPLSGSQAESLAARYLKAQGFDLIVRNYRCKSGEIDIICRNQDLWVFVEVKYRARQDYGGAIGAVSAKQRHRLCKAAQCYLLEQGLNPVHTALRFDVVAINAKQQLEWIRNAFGE